MTARSGSRAIASLLALGLAAAVHPACPGEAVVRVGSKAFTESFILGEIVADVIERAGEARVERKLASGTPASPIARWRTATSTCIPSTRGR